MSKCKMYTYDTIENLAKRCTSFIANTRCTFISCLHFTAHIA